MTLFGSSPVSFWMHFYAIVPIAVSSPRPRHRAGAIGWHPDAKNTAIAVAAFVVANLPLLIVTASLFLARTSSARRSACRASTSSMNPLRYRGSTISSWRRSSFSSDRCRRHVARRPKRSVLPHLHDEPPVRGKLISSRMPVIPPPHLHPGLLSV